MGNAAIFGGNRYLVPFNRGIATTSVRTGLAMTAFFQTPIYLNNALCWGDWGVLYLIIMSLYYITDLGICIAFSGNFKNFVQERNGGKPLP